MSSLDIWLGIGLLLVTLLSTTAHAAMRHYSRVDLMKRLERRGWVQLMERFAEVRDEMLFVMAFLRMSAILGLVMLVTHVIVIRPSVVHGAAAGDASWLAYAAAFATTMLLTMLCGVAIPNAWASYGGTRFLAVTLPVLLVMHRMMFPIAACHQLFDWFARRLAGVPSLPESQNGAEELEKEILDALSEGEAAGAVHEDYADMIEAVVGFRDTETGEIMTPRTEIVALPSTTTLEDAIRLIEEAGHSRIPIHEESLDDIKGVLYAKDLLKIRDPKDFDPLKMMRRVPFVPESKRLPDLLRELREQKVHLAIVLDEYGGTAGLVTIEDILEEIVGEIADEYEVSEPEPIQRIDEHTLEVDARVHIDELNEELHVELPEDDDYDTVGGFVFNVLGKIPQTGEELQHENVRIRVLDAEERRINRLRVEVVAEGEHAS